jgi:hypothetical protein
VSSSYVNESLPVVDGGELQGNSIVLEPRETERQNEEARYLKRKIPPDLEESAPKRHLSPFSGRLHDYGTVQKFPAAPQAPEAAATHRLVEFQQAPDAQPLEQQTLRRYDAPVIPDMDRGWRVYPVLPPPRDPALSALLMATTMRSEEHSSAQTSDSRSKSASPMSSATDPDCGVVASETASEANAAAPKR